VGECDLELEEDVCLARSGPEPGRTDRQTTGARSKRCSACVGSTPKNPLITADENISLELMSLIKCFKNWILAGGPFIPI